MKILFQFIFFLRLQKINLKKMALAESQCYTIINTPELSDIYNEMKLKKDLGECGLTFSGSGKCAKHRTFTCICCFVVAQNKATKMFRSKH